ncbi:MAG: cytidine deaminase [bacterium]|nr:cytidine deaminase [bacterium]
MSTNIKQLVEAAQQAKQNAYAPYSNFPVGAALITESGEIYSGCNVENASYGLTNCAERTAIFKMAADGKKIIKAILVIGDTDDFLPPCGACRQVMAEFSQKNTKVYLCNKHGQWKETSMAELLPFSFSL